MSTWAHRTRHHQDRPDSPELADALRTLIGRYQRAIDASAYLSRTTVVRAPRIQPAGNTVCQNPVVAELDER
jgi:hypothetical protein